MQTHLGVSERRACRVLGQARSTQRYQSKRTERDADLTEQIRALAPQNLRYGYRRIAALLRQGGWSVNLKRVYRLWRLTDMQVPQKQRKRRRIEGTEGAVRLAATYPNHVWSYDFLFDTTENGHTVKLLAVVDEYTRECLALEAARSIKSRDVITWWTVLQSSGATQHMCARTMVLSLLQWRCKRTFAILMRRRAILMWVRI